MNEKITYDTPVVEIIRFSNEDVLTTSGGFDGEVDEFGEDSW